MVQRGPLKPSEQNGTAHFTSDPLFTDTDLDGLTDREEKELYHTDPESQVTYGITEDHQAHVIDSIVDVEDEYNSTVLPGRQHYVDSLRRTNFIDNAAWNPDSASELRNWELDDSSDDFDFVTPDGYQSRETGFAQFSFTALDGSERADVWLPNEAEQHRNLDMWDPNSDDDGLTDGQELHGIPDYGKAEYTTPGAPGQVVTTVYPRYQLDAVHTDPKDADTDGDGWWDGWIGVYDVGRTDNLILYMDNIRTGNGIERSERVDEQAGIHDERDAPVAGNADIDDDGYDEHANLHLGELYWDSEPNDNTEFPISGKQG